MPITKSERNKLRSHTFSEDKKDEFEGTYIEVPDLSARKTLSSSLGLLLSKPLVLILNIPVGLIFSIYIFALLRVLSLANFLWYSAAFFVLGILVISPLAAISKAKLANIGTSSFFSPMLMSLNYLEPLVFVTYFGLALFTIKNWGTITVYSIITFIILLLIAFILHIINISTSISTQIAYDKKSDRNTALNKSWLFLSGQSLSVLSVNIVVFLLLTITVLLDIVYNNPQITLYLALLTFIFADFCASWWQACTSKLYLTITKKAKPIQYSRL